MLICILVSDSFTFVPYIPHYNTDLGQVFLVFLLVVRKSLKVAHKVFTLHFSYFGESSARLKPSFEDLLTPLTLPLLSLRVGVLQRMSRSRDWFYQAAGIRERHALSRFVRVG